MKLILRHFFTFSLIVWCYCGFSQSLTTITGVVLDESSEPLIGASVMIVGANTGALTGLDGDFSITAPLDAELLFSYIGYLDQVVAVGSRTNFTIQMESAATSMDEVVITALGIKRERKALGYSIGEVDGEELEKAKETNVVNSLAGKVPGLVVSQTAAGPSGSTRVMIRGNTELSGSNQPLYVVDGQPLDNTNFASADENGGYDLGDGISSINPDDIENISVLKGPAASALYGSRASHGVILITTKKGSSNDGVSIQFNSTTTIEQQLTSYNNVQTLYGQGTEGRINGSDDRHSSNKSWGPAIDNNLTLLYYDGEVRNYTLSDDGINNFFETGITTTNTVVLNSVKDDNTVRFSYTNMFNDDIIPNSGMSRNSFNLRTTFKVGQKVDIDTKVTYVREDVDNRAALGGDRSNVGTNLITLANTYDLSVLRNNYVNSDGTYMDWNNLDPYNINPYWIIYEMENKSAKDKLSGLFNINYAISENLSLRASGGTDINYLNFYDYAPPTTPGEETGYLQQSNYENRTYNADVLMSYNKGFGKFNFGANLGANFYKVDNKTETVTGTDMITTDIVALQSFSTKEYKEVYYRKQINSAYAMANLDYNNYLYFNSTVRVDQTSTLAVGNNTYLYPSASLSFLLSEVWGVNRDAIPFAKFRASVAQVGSDTDPYSLTTTYTYYDKPYGSYSSGGIDSTFIPNTDLMPTRTNSYELGMDMHFLQSRIGLEVTYYSQVSRDQIIRMNTSTASGYYTKYLNAGEITNEGIEIALNTTPVRSGDFRWDVDFNFSKNSNVINELADGVTNFTMASATWLDVTVDAVVGENYGTIMGRDFLRNENGDIIVNANTGYPEVTDTTVELGNASWDWTGGMTTRFSYKNFALAAIFDVKVGADIYSMTARSMYSSGKAEETVEGRDAWYKSEEMRLAAGISEANWTATGGYLVDGVIANSDGTYSQNDIYIDPEDYWSFVSTTVPSVFVYDNSYVKCREITFSYQVNEEYIRGFAEKMTLSLVARNPFIIYKNIPNIDPDSNYNNSSGLGLELGSLPSRRSYGFNINMTF